MHAAGPLSHYPLQGINMYFREKLSMHTYLTVILSIHFSVAATEGNTTAGRAIYERLCVSCHGQDGRGGRMSGMLPVLPRNLADHAYMNTRSDQHLFDVIRQGGAAMGLSPAMRAFEAELSDEEIRSTIAYVRTLAARRSPSAGVPEVILSEAGHPNPDLRMARLRVSIWPEYDDPRVLIVFRGDMVPSDAFPTSITLDIPKGADIIDAGMISEQNELLIHPHQIRPGETHDSLELNVPVARFFVEFYYDPFANGEDKRFIYTLPANFAIERLEIDIQQPLHAINFTTTPQPMRQSTDEQGFTYHWFSYHNIAGGESQRFTVSYTKTTTAPSVAKRQPEPAVVTPPRIPLSMTLTAFGLLIGVVGLFGGCAWLWLGYQRRRNAIPGSREPHLETVSTVVQTGTPEVGTASRTDTPNFCANCGRRLQPAYRFCPGCGQPLHQTNLE
ncbi:hypothetical protein NKDENANG_02082 [Candidatus Entotheonellaceae bacterium PAL068K]